jgi:DNA (cytosine-5)-methyltransferase 1
MNRPPELRIHHDEIIVDNFAGGGGASLGIEWGLGRSPDIAINHDAQAIAMHQANHPGTRHYCEDVWKVDPREACRGRPVGLAWFSPDCKHFSKAKGGKPVDKKIRGLAWVVIRWAKAVRPRVICLENVEEFEDWGPLLDNGRPCPERVGLTFRIWRGKLEALGYRVEHRELVAADYGTPTTRKRLFLVARRDGLPIVWPTATHGKGRLAWRTAAECIDWSLPTYSIFLTREEARPYKIVRPLAENTMRRIWRGLDRFVINNPRPFLVPYYGGGKDRAHELSEPIRTLTGDPKYSLVTPFLTEHANASSPRSFSAAEPLRTQCAQVKGGHFALVAPTLVTTGYGERPGQAPRAPGLDKPLGTLVAAFLAKHYGGHETPGSALPRPMDTVTAQDHNALVASSIVKLKGTAKDGQQLDLPLHTVQAGGNHYAQVNAFMVAYYGNEKDGGTMKDPMRTLTAKERFGLVTVHGEPYAIADIGMRMLAPRELYRAQGFPDDYIINPVVDGRQLPKDAQVRCVGNSVCPPVAAALARAQFEDQVSEVAA